MIKNKRKIIFAAAIVTALAGGSVAVFAAVNTFASIKSMISTGGVKIDVSAYTEEQGRTVPLTEKTVVDCNGSASYIPTIVNNGESCYVRIRLAADTDIQQIDILKALKDVNSSWKAINGYLYYMKPLNHKEKTEVCRGFDVPGDWDYMADNEMNIKVTADAIQAENLIPDFESEHPWGDVEILESDIKNDYTVNTVSPADIKTDDIKINSDGFFENISFMPGTNATIR